MEYIQFAQNTEAFVKNRLLTEGSGHDWWHMVRVRNLAKRIHLAEGGDWNIIEPAVLLHDVGDRKVIKQENDDYSIAYDFLVSQNVEPVVTERIMSVIQTMSYSKSFDGASADTSIERNIVYDADKLDAMGAIGIARAFAYGGSADRLIYDPTYEPIAFTSSTEYKNATSSTFHHFAEKLLLLKDLLHTQTAKDIAGERDAYMRQFLAEFLAEWNGEK